MFLLNEKELKLSLMNEIINILLQNKYFKIMVYINDNPYIKIIIEKE